MAVNLSNINLNDIASDSVFKCAMPLNIIYSDAFNNVSTLTDIEIYDAYDIENDTFANCSNLTSLILPGIEDYSNKQIFGQSKLNLQHFEILENTKKIGNLLSSTISEDNPLNLKLPMSLQEILPSALYSINCDQLFLSPNTILCSNALNGVTLYKLRFNPAIASPLLSLSSCNINDTVYCFDNTVKYTLNTQLSGCNASEIIFQNNGNNITAITENAFSDCNNISYINLINSSITELPRNTFANCYQLQSIYLPSSIIAYQPNCFLNCNALKNFNLDISNIKYIYGYIGYNATVINIPSTIEYIGNAGFKNVTTNNSDIKLTRLSYIGLSAFYNDTNIRSSIENIELPSNISQIPEYCFYNQTRLQNINLNNITSINKYAFYNNANITSINIDNVLSIEDYAFTNCIQLSTNGDSKLTIFSKPQNIGNNVFQNTNIEKVIIGNELSNSNSNIGNTIFNNCTNLTYIQIQLPFKQFIQKLLPDKYNDDIVENVIINRTNSTVIIDVFNDVCNKLYGTTNSNIETIECNDLTLTPDGSANDYICLTYLNPSTKETLLSVINTSPDYSVFKSNPILLANTLSINTNAFNSVKNGDTALSSINLNETISAASGILSNSLLQSVICNKLTSITDYMFANSTNIQSIYAHNATKISPYGLCGCISLTDISNIDKVKYVDTMGLAYCSNIDTIPFINVLSSCAASAFISCTSLQHINSAQLSNMNGNYTFAECHNMLTFSAPLTAIGQHEFNNCTKLYTIDLNNSYITSLPSNVFGNTPKLKTLRLPSSLNNLAPNSLNCNATNLSVHLNVSSRDDIQDLLNTNNIIKSPNGTFFYTNDSKYPSFITTSSTNILKVKNVNYNVNADGKLIGINNNVFQINDESIDNLNGIASTAFKNSYLNNIVLSQKYLTYLNTIDNATFSISNASHLKQIIFTCKSSDVSLTNVISFYTNKTSRNDNIIIQFEDAYFNGHNNSFVYSSDVFTYDVINGKYIITGVIDKNINNDNIIINDRYTDISSYAFANTLSLLNIIDFNNISCILPYAFTYNTSITSLNIGQSDNKKITLCNDVFFQSNIHDITINDNITNINTNGISGYGLNQCINLNSITYSGNNIKHIAPSAMINYISELSDVTLPNSLEHIGDYAFAKTFDYFPRIKNINFGDINNLTSIGKYAFYNSIQSVPNNKLSFPKNLKIIDDAAFMYRNEAYTHQISDLITGSDIQLINAAYESVEPADLNITNIQTIGMSAFMNNKFKNINLGNNINTISSYAFANSKYKYNIFIPNSIQHIGYNAFYKNVILNPYNIKNNIISIDCDISQISSIFDITIDNELNADNIAGFTDNTIISTLQTINPYNAFIYIYDNKMMFSPTNLSIDLFNFALISANNSISSAYVQPYIKCIAPSAFYNCNKLTSLSVYQNISANNILSIGQYAFYNCSSLNNIYNNEIHDEIFYLSNVNDYAFYNCQQLSNIKVLSSIEYIGDYAFTNCNAITSIFDQPSLELFQYWKLHTLGDYAFASCDSLTSFNIPSTISSFGQHIFNSCSSLSNINMDINSSRFLEITKYNDISTAVYILFNDINTTGSCYINFRDVIYMNNGIIKIDNEYTNTYDYDDNNIYISSLNYSKFINDKKTYLNLSSITGIDQFVFSNCNQLESISFISENTLKYIGDYAFNKCINLINFNNGIFNGTYIGKFAFANCIKLLKFDIDYQQCITNETTIFNYGAFYGTSLNSINIVNIPLSEPLFNVLNNIKRVFQYDEVSNINPLELPEYCVISLYNEDNTLKGKYDFIFNNLIGATIDINRNTIIFADKQTHSVTPLLLIKQVNDQYLPALVNNTFHMNIIGRWK